jgi:hypothetical protein
MEKLWGEMRFLFLKVNPSYKKITEGVSWGTPEIPALRRLRWEDSES